METPTQIYKGHVAGVMSCDWSEQKARIYRQWPGMLTHHAQQVRPEKNLFRDHTTEPSDCGTEMKVVPGILTIRNECRGCSTPSTPLLLTLSCQARMMATLGERSSSGSSNRGCLTLIPASFCRIWKTNASTKLGPIDTRERQSMEYRRKLREKWGNEKGVREIERYVVYFQGVIRQHSSSLCIPCRQRRLPSNIKNAAALKKTMLDARKTKDENRRRHTREGLVKPTAERKSEYGGLV